MTKSELTQKLAEKFNLPPRHARIIVDAFFEYVAQEHIGEINTLTTQIRDDRGYSYA